MSEPSLRRVQRVRHDLRRRQLTVSRVDAAGPGFAAITFTGPDLADFVSLSFDDHVKLMIPGAGGDLVRRDYTPRRFDVQRRELTIEFALHGHGPAADWARQARPGQQVGVGGPRGSMIVPLDVDWHVLAGDASALPAITRRLEELPTGSHAQVLVQLADAADERRFDTRAQLQLKWVRDSAAWLAALAAMTLPPGDGFVWCAGEARTMAQARDLLLLHHHHPREALRVAAYWKAGAADFHETLEG